MPDRHHHHHHWQDRDRNGYAYHAGDPGPGPNFHRLRRDMRNKKVAGVCAGLANYYGWDVNAVRVLTVVGIILIQPFGILTYIAAALFVKADGGQPLQRSAEDERFWRTFSIKPKATFSELKHRFRALDARVRDMERAVTSDEYGLRKAFQDLERGA